MELTKAEITESLATIWDKLGEGDSDSEIMDLMGVDAELYNRLKRMMLDQKADELRKRPIEHVYAEYIINQVQNIGAVTKIYESASADKNHNAAIAAIRTRADLYDRLIVKGQECGVFKKAPEQRALGGSVALAAMVADMSTEDIKLALAKAVSSMARMMKRFGDHDIIDSPSETIHYGEPLPAEETAMLVAPRSKGEAALAAAKKSSPRGKSKRTKSTKHIRGGRREVRVLG